MNMADVNETMKLLTQADLSGMDIEDQYLILRAHSDFCEKIRPVLIKYASNSKQTFLFKMQKGERNGEDI